MSTSTTMKVDQEDVAIDAGRAFIGPNASFYDESWRVMLWRGKRTSWNPHAALMGPVWFAYRRMFAPALVWIAALQFLWFAHDRGFSVWFLAILLGTCMATSGLFANAIYLHHFNRCSNRAQRASSSVLEQEQQLIEDGGVSPAAVYAFTGLLAVQTYANLVGPFFFE
ncbi:MAG: hypothetical protein R3C97_02085 [Geminicoccaceae bacterium]